MLPEHVLQSVVEGSKLGGHIYQWSHPGFGHNGKWNQKESSQSKNTIAKKKQPTKNQRGYMAPNSNQCFKKWMRILSCNNAKSQTDDAKISAYITQFKTKPLTSPSHMLLLSRHLIEPSKLNLSVFAVSAYCLLHGRTTYTVKKPLQSVTSTFILFFKYNWWSDLRGDICFQTQNGTKTWHLYMRRRGQAFSTAVVSAFENQTTILTETTHLLTDTFSICHPSPLSIWMSASWWGGGTTQS